jgi:hypothetical protein
VPHTIVAFLKCGSLPIIAFDRANDALSIKSIEAIGSLEMVKRSADLSRSAESILVTFLNKANSKRPAFQLSNIQFWSKNQYCLVYTYKVLNKNEVQQVQYFPLYLSRKPYKTINRQLN